MARARVPRQVRGPPGSPGLRGAPRHPGVADEEALVFGGREHHAHLLRVGRARGPRVPGRRDRVPRPRAQEEDRRLARCARRARAPRARLREGRARGVAGARRVRQRDGDDRRRPARALRQAQPACRRARRRAHRHRGEPLRRHEVARMLRDARGDGPRGGAPGPRDADGGPRGHAAPRWPVDQIRRARLQRLLVLAGDGLPAGGHGPGADARLGHRRAPPPQGPRDPARPDFAALALQHEDGVDGRGGRLRAPELHGLHPDARDAPQGRQEARLGALGGSSVLAGSV
mmetsp:Transcript_25181/g.77622  ORF Transcript_25181/g.77622 Transcript_25181/m.77622 type:complete len:288 (-) Transcript_25181:22-885(-)